MRHHLPAFLVVALATVLPGCSYLCRFEARGCIQEAANGQPIASVKVELVDPEGNALADPTTTNARGKFELSFETTPSAARVQTGWSLVLTAEGYIEEKINIGTVKEPKNANETVYLIFRASMRKAH
jgi:hypothetical protein